MEYMQTLWQTGDPSGLATLSHNTELTVPTLTAVVYRASPFDMSGDIGPGPGYGANRVTPPDHSADRLRPTSVWIPGCKRGGGTRK